jgi:hypothetical protein
MMLALLLAWTVQSVAAQTQGAGQATRLALEIRSEQDTLRAGDAIPITFVITNVGAITYKYVDRGYDRSGRIGEYRLRAYDERGTPVEDPRTLARVPQGYAGGGLGSFAELQPGQWFSKTIDLNLWALVAQAGVYTVHASYAADNGQTLESAPLMLRVLPRSDDEMGRYIDELAAQLQRGTESEQHQLIRRLMYTADRRAVKPLLEVSSQDNNTAFWIGEGFSYYLPRDSDVLAEAFRTIRRTGFSPSSLRILEQLEAPPEMIQQLIGESLLRPGGASEEATSAAQRYPDDRFTAQLIQLAASGPADIRARAIYALAYHRTDEGVATLKRLREDFDPAIRKTTEHAIESAYRQYGTGRGRPLRAGDFPDLANR